MDSILPNTRWIVALLLAALASCGDDGPDVDREAYEASILQWREARRAALLKPTGFLTLVGLHWLDSETTRFGGAPDNDFVVPGDAAPYIGEFRLTGEGVLLVPNEGVDVRRDGEPVGGTLIPDDTTGEPGMITHRALGFSVSKRDGRFAIRLRDFENPVLQSFPALPYYPVDPAWRIEATLERYPEPRIADVDTVIDGLGYHPESPGRVVFEIDGTAHDLEAYASGDRLFLVFADETSGRHTYGAGRFLYADAPGENGVTVLDFNRAYSPPCAFNDFSTCPVATARNRLPVAVTAGEKYEPAAYAGSAGQR